MKQIWWGVALFLLPIAYAAGHDPNLGAINGYNLILSENPDDLVALRARGSTFRALEYFDSALVDLSRADSLDPDNAENVAEIGFCHYHLGERKKCSDYLARAEALMLAAMALGEVPEEDLAVLERELREYRFRDFVDRELYEKALVEGEKLAGYLSGKLSFHCDLADVLLNLGRVEEALTYYQTAWEANQTYERYVVGLASCFLRLGQPQEALRLFDPWREEDPEADLPLLHQAFVLAHYLNDDPGAAALLAEAETRIRARLEGEEYPELEDVVILARICFQVGRIQDSWDLLDSLMEDYRGHWLVVHLQSLNARALGREDEALRYANEARLYKRLNPFDWLQAYDLPAPEPEPEPEPPLAEAEPPALFKKPWFILTLGGVFLLVFAWTLHRKRACST